jgi:2-polyprenyl-3-methyl-5-hydroxy-6-metoxy-1,4-benzoquinol methylase
MSSQKLDEFKNSYGETKPFFDENLRTLKWYSQKIAKCIAKSNYKNVLSLGIGHEVVSSTLVSKLGTGSKYTVLEGSAAIIQEFKNSFQVSASMNIVHTYFENFEAVEKFDAIEMGFVLEHVDEPRKILEKYKRFLSSNGTIFIAVPNAKSLHRRIGYEAGLLEDFYRLSEMDLQFGHQRYFDFESISKLVTESGLKIKKSEGLFLKPLTERQLKSLDLSDSVWTSLFKIGDTLPEICNSIYIEAVL